MQELPADHTDLHSCLPYLICLRLTHPNSDGYQWFRVAS
jgi:hypothetical protein